MNRSPEQTDVFLKLAEACKQNLDAMEAEDRLALLRDGGAQDLRRVLGRVSVDSPDAAAVVQNLQGYIDEVAQPEEMAA